MRPNQSNKNNKQKKRENKVEKKGLTTEPPGGTSKNCSTPVSKADLKFLNSPGKTPRKKPSTELRTPAQKKQYRSSLKKKTQGKNVSSSSACFETKTAQP
jgi:hypothetical protein